MDKRYLRQIILPEIGEKGQEKLRNAKVLIVGVGGLGSPNALYLAGAGVGTIGLMDNDTVSPNNLHRQILYTEHDIGFPKVERAARRLRNMNNNVCIHTYPYLLENQNAMDIISRYDIVIDGCDNYPTRYLISDICSQLHIPYIYGAITAFEGQVAILCHPSGKKSYRDLYPNEEQLVTTPENKGVIPTTPGIVGCTQANEALKLICGYGHPLIDRLWTINLITLETCNILL